MKITTEFNKQHYAADLNKPIDISLPLQEGQDTVNCFWATYMDVAPVRMGSFVGSTQEGGAVNFVTVKDLRHTEMARIPSVWGIFPKLSIRLIKA